MGGQSLEQSSVGKVPDGMSHCKQTKTVQGIEEKLHHRIVAKVGPPVLGKVPIDTSLAMRMHRAGFSYKQIGLYFGISGCTVKRRLREAGLI